MDKQNYRESLEKDRQEISVESSEGPTRRAQRHTISQKSKKRKSLLLPSLFFIFILIPVAVLFYVAFFFEPDDTLTTEANENEVSFEINPPSNDTPIVPEEAEEEETKEEPAEEEPAEAPEEEKSEQQPQQEEPAEAEPAEPVEQEPEEQPEAQPETQPEEPAEQPEAQQQGQKTVVVKDNETLYRIAVNNYGASGAGAAVEKIKQANGLASNEIYVGQTLILP